MSMYRTTNIKSDLWAPEENRNGSRHTLFYRYVTDVMHGFGFTAITPHRDGTGCMACDPSSSRAGHMECTQLEPGMDIVMMDIAAGHSLGDRELAIDLGDRLLLRFFLKGSIDYRYNDKTLPPATDNTFLLAHSPDGSTISHRVHQSAFQHVCVYIDRYAINELLQTGRAEVPGLLGQFCRGEVEGLAFDGGAMPLGLQNVVLDLWRCEFEGHTRRLYLKAKVLELLCILVNAGLRRKQMSARLCLPDQDRKKLNRARQLLETQFADPPSLRELAKQVGLNRNKLSQGFQELFGQSVARFGRECRLTHAKSLLASGRYNVDVVAARVGYCDSSSFIAAFKARYGLSPGKIN